MTKIAITSMGIVSALGTGVSTHLAQLRAEKSGVAKCSEYPTHVFAATHPLSNAQLKSALNLPDSEDISRTALLGLLAAKEAWQNQNSGEKTAFINGSTVGGMDLSENYFADLYREKPTDEQLLAMHDLGTVTNFIAKNVGDFDFVNTISTACSSAANAIMMGAKLIQTGAYNRVLVGGTDALSEFTIQGFKSLMVYSDQWCMPFGEDRTGLNLGEGAAYLVLENAETAQKNNTEILGFLTGWANANDAYHNTGTSPEGLGAQLSIKEAMKIADVGPKEICYINAHGTATQNNDSSELAAMQTVFGEVLPPFSSTKAFTGHTLATAGAIEACISILSLREQYIFPNLNAQKPIETSGKLVEKGRSANIENVLSNSFGFGGNCTSLIFSKANV